MTEALLDPNGLNRLREALHTADYTAEGIERLLGPGLYAALRGNDYGLVRRRLTDGGPLATLVRLFACGSVEPPGAVAHALSPLPLADARAANLIRPAGDGLRAAVELHPYGDGEQTWWVVADLPLGLRGSPLRPDHVLGVGPSSTTLAGMTIRRPVDTALDLGTGCGVQALHLSRHAGHVTGTDLSHRALRFAATTAALSGKEWELLDGDLTAPVSGRRFDLVVSNPPFIVGPPERDRYTYRDSGRAGDEVFAELIAEAPKLLNDGGHFQFLANWIHPADGDWAERIAGMIAGTGLDAWVVQRQVADPVDYVRLWLRDPGGGTDRPDDGRRADDWLRWLERHRIEAVGFGLVTLRAGGHDDPVVRVEELTHQVDEPFGTEVADWFRRQDWLRAHRGDDILSARLRAADDLYLYQKAVQGDEGWQVDAQHLVSHTGSRWNMPADPVAVDLVGGSTGTARLGDQLDVLSVAHDIPPADLRAAALPVVTDLVERGILLPVDD